MRPVLLALGPWNLTALPVIFAVLYAIMLAWQWAEWRYGQGKKLDALRYGVTVVPAALLTVLVFLGVNKIAPVEIKAWGTMLVVAFAVGTFLLAVRGDRSVVKPAQAVDLALWALVGAIIGSRVIFVALDWEVYAGHPLKLLNVWEGGLSFHGGLLGALIAGLFFARRNHLSFWALLDEATPGIALGYCFARVGCFLNGCCHGHACNLPWAMNFPHGELPGQLVHPTQLYALLSTAVIFVILSELRGKVRVRGHLFALYLALYSIERFLLEFTRAGATGKYVAAGAWLTAGQLASILIWLVAVLGMALTWNLKAKSPAPVAVEPPPDKRADGKQH